MNDPTRHSDSWALRLMSGAMRTLRRARFWLFRERVSRDLEDEMRLHRELRAQQLGDAASGIGDATAGARRRFGNPLKVEEQSREEWGWSLLDECRQNLRYATRRLRQRAGFSVAVVAILALGIGATTAMFTTVDAAMLRPLPFEHAEELVSVPEVEVRFDGARGFPAPGFHSVELADLRPSTGHSPFSHAAAWASGGMNLSDPDHPVRLTVGVVTVDFFATLGVRALRGRVFSTDEGKPHGPRVAVLSYRLWQRQFGGRSMLDQAIRLNNRIYTVVGIMPRGFTFPRDADLWIPLSTPATFESFEPFRGTLPTEVIARLAPSWTVAAAADRVMAQWQLGLGAAARDPKRSYLRERLASLAAEGAVIPMQQTLVGDRSTALIVLLCATGLLLLIACTNVTNLLLSQAALRRREVALRAMLGASRARILRQLLGESLLLTGIGAITGLGLALVGLEFTRSLIPRAMMDIAPVHLDLRVLIFTLVLSAIVGIGFGLWPAFAATTGTEAVKAGGEHGSTRAHSTAGRRLLIGVEVALSVTLLVGAGLMLRSFGELARVDVGMQTQHVGSLEVAFARDTDRGRHRTLVMGQIVDRMQHTPGIEAAALVNLLPLSGEGSIGGGVSVDGVPPVTDDMKFASNLVISPDYFATMGIPLLRGRTFDARDDDRDHPVAVINRRMAEAYWPGGDPIGRTFHYAFTGPASVTVVGVAADVHVNGLDQQPWLATYFPYRVQPPTNIAFIARGSLPSAALLARMQQAVHAIDPTLPVFRLRMMDDVASASIAPRRTNTLLISLFAALALILASVGVYAVLSHSVAQRRREFGIRAALGASGAQLIRAVMLELALVIAIGVVAGLAGAWVLVRFAESLLFGVSAHDPITFILVPIALLIPATVATLVPARRAARVQPAEVLRAE